MSRIRNIVPIQKKAIIDLNICKSIRLGFYGDIFSESKINMLHEQG